MAKKLIIKFDRNYSIKNSFFMLKHQLINIRTAVLGTICIVQFSETKCIIRIKWHVYHVLY